MIIAVDGPAASGKGTIARALARHYALPYLEIAVGLLLVLGLFTRAVAVIAAMSGQTFDAPSGYKLTMDATNHHLHKPVMIGEIQANGQFEVVYKTKTPIRAQPWSPFISGNESKQSL